MLNPAILSAVAALAGTSVGAIAPMLSTYLLQRGAVKRDLLLRDMGQREALYAEFLLAAGALYAKSLTETIEEFTEIVLAYTLIGRMRLTSSDAVVNAAEHVLEQVVRQMGEPNLTISQIVTSGDRALAIEQFSIACRLELRRLAPNDSMGRSSANVQFNRTYD